MKVFLLIVLALAIIPATYGILGIPLLLFWYLANGLNSTDFVFAIIVYFLWILGYVGLLICMTGLHKTNHIRKIVLLSCGFIGSVILFIGLGSEGISWIGFRSIWRLYPILACTIFLVMTSIDLVNKNNKKVKR